jgi:hypothetical protein
MEEITLDGVQAMETPVIDDIPSSITKKEISQKGTTSSGDPMLIGEISSAAYGGFTKILSLLTGNLGKTDIISIEKGKLNTLTGGGHLYCDLSTLFGDKDFAIINPQHNIKMMKLITGGDTVIFVDDPSENKYYISNTVDGVPQINITLEKPDASMATKITKPDIGDHQEKLINIDPDLVSTITSAEKTTDSQYLILEIFEKNGVYSVASISTDKEKFKFNFKDLTDTGVEVKKYKLFNPFPIPKPDEIDFDLYKSTDDNSLWIKTSSEVGMAKIDYSEKITPMGVFDTFSLV